MSSSEDRNNPPPTPSLSGSSPGRKPRPVPGAPSFLRGHAGRLERGEGPGRRQQQPIWETAREEKGFHTGQKHRAPTLRPHIPLSFHLFIPPSKLPSQPPSPHPATHLPRWCCSGSRGWGLTPPPGCYRRRSCCSVSWPPGRRRSTGREGRWRSPLWWRSPPLSCCSPPSPGARHTCQSLPFTHSPHSSANHTGRERVGYQTHEAGLYIDERNTGVDAGAEDMQHVWGRH